MHSMDPEIDHFDRSEMFDGIGRARFHSHLRILGVVWLFALRSPESHPEKGRIDVHCSPLGGENLVQTLGLARLHATPLLQGWPPRNTASTKSVS